MHNHPKHIEYFYITNKKYCDKSHSNCYIYGWGVYVNRKFHTIKYFCIRCFDVEVRDNLIKHQNNNNCLIEIKGLHNERLPNFLLELSNQLNGINQMFLPIPERLFA